MDLETDRARDPPPTDLLDVRLGDGEIIVYDPDAEPAWVQGEAVAVER